MSENYVQRIAELEAHIRDLEREQIAEMNEHLETMQEANRIIERLGRMSFRVAKEELIEVKKYWDWYKGTDCKTGGVFDNYLENKIKILENAENNVGEKSDE